MDEFKRALIEHALRRTEGNRTEAAKLLGIQRAYFYRLMQRLRVEAPPRVASAGDSG
jgi:DNA-binding NtrC family response regulator